MRASPAWRGVCMWRFGKPLRPATLLLTIWGLRASHSELELRKLADASTPVHVQVVPTYVQIDPAVGLPLMLG